MWSLLDDEGPFPSDAGADAPRQDPALASVLPLFGAPEDDGIMGWQERALCAQTDPEAFFPEKGGSTREAKKVCSGCDVRGECLEYALAHDERFGIWGGLSERERRKLKRRVV
ncbi:WhiB family transcriptional regulator [Cellulomonas sp. C5510]|uniref:WhiB family transcriptional regulator n=1 Tax=Cellulomonas sp. C5510 TaxID=2871170 RepID=UPI002714C736|nr:WhiB family transcriptional regulator [Cellulomonas sp. C5510]